MSRGAIMVCCLLLLFVSCGPPARDQIVVGSKNFTEQLVLGEIMAQQIESKTHLQVERRFFLAGTYICQQAILAGRIDLYPEYTGTGVTAILKEKPEGGRRSCLQSHENRIRPPLQSDGRPILRFQQLLRHRNPRRRCPPPGPQNDFPGRRLHPEWRPGFGYEFMERPDGYKGLVATYGLRFAEAPRIMDLGLLARALTSKQIDLAAGNTTDGLIQQFDLFVLADDRHYFPPYEAVPVIRDEIITRHPEVKAALDELAGKISDEEMRQLNYSVEGQHQDVTVVVRNFLQQKGL